MKKVLVTGGAGFIGSHVADQLIKSGNNVILIDNLSTGIIENVNSKAIFYKLDITDENIKYIFEKEKPEYVFHNAAQINVKKSLENPIYDMKNNIFATLNLLECCKKYKVKKIIYSSTAAVYGEPNYLGVDEDHKTNPVSNYGVSKYSAEEYIKTYSRLYGIEFTILRYANVYGPRQTLEGEAGVISIFLNKLFSGQSPYIFGDGIQTRDYIYVKDIVRANMLAIKGGNNQTLNIGTGIETSVNDLFYIIKNLINTNAECTYAPKRKSDILKSYFNTKLSTENLSFNAEYTLEKGLKETIEYYKKNNNLIIER